MTSGADTRARRYLLGLMTDDERAAVEQEYFAAPDALDGIAAAEDALIEDYLEGTLTPDERAHFERDYLASPQHRRRVEIVRRLALAASPEAAAVSRDQRASPAATAAGERPRWMRSLSLAAAVVLGTGIVFWLLPRNTEAPAPGAGPVPPMADARPPESSTVPAPVPPPPAAPAPRVFALALSPATTRSGGDVRTLVVPPDVDIVALSLEGDAGGAAATRATIETVTGDPIWRGNTRAGDRGGIIASADVPSDVLRPDDYVVTVYGRESRGTERELERYFLRVRSR